MFNKEELLQLRHHLKCSVIYNVANESQLMEGSIVSGGQLLLKTALLLDEMDKAEQSSSNSEAKAEHSPGGFAPVDELK